MWWGEVIIFCEYYKINKMWQTNSTFIYFDKEKSKEIFTKAQDVYLDKCEYKQHKKWGVADEFCFNIKNLYKN